MFWFCVRLLDGKMRWVKQARVLVPGSGGPPISAPRRLPNGRASWGIWEPSPGVFRHLDATYMSTRLALPQVGRSTSLADFVMVARPHETSYRLRRRFRPERA